ncbi:MAG TPA: trehalose-phosphatase [Myxococcaceae bacterium]|jgi:trehalose 6-phosphate phosphatase
MEPILARANARVLAQLSWSDLLVAFDFDGTLAPIVDEPRRAVMPPRTRELLERLCALYPCVVISGRAQGDVLKRTRGVGLREVIGNHGLEPWRQTDELVVLVRGWVRHLSRALAALPGVEIEDKGVSVAVHYRGCRQIKIARQAILEAAAGLGPLRLVGGRMVVNLIPEGAPHKGIALEASRDRLGCDTALYVGDDETDEDVFAMDEPGRLLGIRVGASSRSRAPFFIDSQPEVDRLIETLILLRAGGERRRVHS